MLCYAMLRYTTTCYNILCYAVFEEEEVCFRAVAAAQDKTREEKGRQNKAKQNTYIYTRFARIRLPYSTVHYNPILLEPTPEQHTIPALYKLTIPAP